MLSAAPDPTQGSREACFAVYSPGSKTRWKSDLLYRAIFAGSLLCWLVMTGLLVQREILPRYQTPPARQGYRAILEGVTEARFTRMGIFRYDRQSEDLRRVGTAESEIWPQPDGSWRLVSRTRMDEQLEIESESIVGSDYKLRHLHVEGRWKPLVEGKADGTVEGHMLRLKIELAGAELELSFDMSDENFQIDSSGAFDIPGDLRVNQSWRTVQFNLLMPNRPTIYDARVLRLDENFYWEGERRTVYVVAFTQQGGGGEVTCYVSPEGEILEQHTRDHVLRLEKSSRDPD